MAKRKPQTQSEKEYSKELRRIKAFIRQASKRGYTFDDSIIPPKPKKVTKASVKKLKQITPKTLYQSSEFLNPQTGDIITGSEGRVFERRLAAHKAQLTKAIKATTKKDKRTQTTNRASLPRQSTLILDNIRQAIASWTPSSTWSTYWEEVKRQDKNKLETLLEGTVSADGEIAVARRLQESADDIERIVNSILYGSDEEQVQFDLVHFATIILGRSLSVEESAELTDLQERQEDYT